MKIFIKNIVLFTAFSIVFYIVAIPFWRSCLPGKFSPNINYRIGGVGHTYSRIKEFKEYINTDSLDILFLGSSHTYRGFDTRIFSENGLKSFNLGSSAQTPIQTITLLYRYLDKAHPKLIIYEVYPPKVASDGVESSLDIIANDKNDIHSYSMAFQINHIKTWNTLVYGSYRDMFNLNKSFNEPVFKKADTYISGGFVEKKIGYYSPQPLSRKKIILDKNQLNKFENVINEIKNRGIRLILVYAPIPKINYSRYTNNNYFDSLMTTYSDYYNFNKMINLNDSLHFYDSDHLNQSGVEIFNNKLLEILNK